MFSAFLPHLTTDTSTSASVARRRWRIVGCAVVLSLATACAGAGERPSSPKPTTPSTTPSTPDSATSEPTASSPAPPPGQIHLAFAGDVHFERQLRPLLQNPDQALDPIRPALSDADLTMVNLETAVTDAGTAEDKRYTFRAGPAALDALQAAGVDVAAMANNHAVDYGADGLNDSLAAAEESPVGVVGIGADADAAYAPDIRTVRGTRVAFLAADAFADPTTDNHEATEDEPGIAVALDSERLLQEVRDVRERADVVVTYLHWGIERQDCPTADQRDLAQKVAEAGADVVVGSHAHVQLGAGILQDGYAAYGLGNFVWYSRNSPAEQTTGVLTLTLDDRKVVRQRWTPATIQPSGVPEPAAGQRRENMIEDFNGLRECADLGEVPTEDTDGRGSTAPLGSGPSDNGMPSR